MTNILILAWLLFCCLLCWVIPEYLLAEFRLGRLKLTEFVVMVIIAIAFGYSGFVSLVYLLDVVSAAAADTFTIKASL